MASTNFIPSSDGKFLVWLKALIAYLLTHYVKWNIPDQEISDLTTSTNDFEQAYTASEAPAYRTSVMVSQKNKARKAAEKKLRAFLKSFIRFNPLVTDADKESMGLPLYKTTRVPSQIANTYPDYDIDSSILRQLGIHFYDHGSKSHAKPEGQYAAEICWSILDHAPVSTDELTHAAIDTRSPYTITFQENERGKTVYFCLRWINTRGEHGPWSEIISAIVP